MNVSVKIEGIERAVHGLKVLPDKFQKGAILSIFRRSTKPIITRSRSRLQGYGSQYANLAKSIGNITAKSRNPILFVGPRIKGKWKYVGYIAHWVEYGTKGIKSSRGGSARTERDRQFAPIVAMIPKGGRYRADQPAMPFMRPAIDQSIPEMKKGVADNFSKLLDKQIARYLKKL